MELHSSKRTKVESESSSSQQQLVGSNLLHLQDADLDFETLRWTPSFVDKTMLIQTIMKDEHRIILTAPPRFGKTMARNMLRMFFEIGDKKHEFFKDLKIYKCSEQCTDNHDCESKQLFRKHCGQHPVISLDFADLSASTYSAFLETLRAMITSQFKKYKCLIHKDAEKYTWSSMNLGDLDIDRFLRYMAPADKDNYWMRADDGVKGAYIYKAFRYLIKVLSAHYQTKQTHKKIIVLVDEYDAPLMELLFNEHSDERIFTVIRHLMRLLCKEEISAEFVGRVVIFSVTASGGGMLSLGANNVVRRTFLDKDYVYCKFFGFTKEEVEALVKSTVTENQRQKEALDVIAVWYNNYTIIGDEDTTICNPLSIRLYLSNLIRKNYWVDSVGTKYICELFKSEKVREKLFPAIRDDHNISINPTTIQLDDIYSLKSLSESILNCIDDNQIDLALQFLTECGYFNVIKKGSWYWTLKIPNQELKETFRDKLCHALLNSKTNLFDVKQQEAFLNALESLGCGKEHEPMKYVAFKKSVENLYSNRELPKTHFHFHCDLWMLIFGSGKFRCFSELPIKKTWSAKLDLMIITKNGTAIIIELKRDERDSAKDGLKECLKKEYYKAFQLEGNRGGVEYTILMGLHLSDNRKVSIRYLENFESETLSDEQNRETLINTIVDNSYECSDV